MFLKIAHRFDSFVRKASHVFIVLGGILTVAMVFITTYGVVMRYFFRRPEPISYELCTIFMLWAFLLAISSVELFDQHIRADIFIQFAPPRLRNFLHSIVSRILGFVYCIILTWKGWDVAMYSLKINERSFSVWGEPLFPIKILIPICYGLLSLVIFRNLCHGIIEYRSKTLIRDGG